MVEHKQLDLDEQFDLMNLDYENQDGLEFFDQDELDAYYNDLDLEAAPY